MNLPGKNSLTTYKKEYLYLTKKPKKQFTKTLKLLRKFLEKRVTKTLETTTFLS